MKITQLTLIALFAGSLLSCTVIKEKAREKADYDTQNWVYELEAAGIGAQGTHLVKVWSYSKLPGIATEQAKKNAVHGIIFRGYPGKSGIPGLRPMAMNPNLEIERKDFFDPFFAQGGKYMKFVALTNEGRIAAGDRLKVGGRYKIGITVTVYTAELRKDLENAGIIRRLGSAF
jgi:hypothetical protein